MTRIVKHTTARARQLRRNQTKYEQRLWQWLRAHRFFGHKFRRQHPVGEYFLDFACASLLLGIELDGAGHFEQAAWDAERDEWLGVEGWEILRFGNDDVEHRFADVLEAIVRAVRRRVSPLPDPLPHEGEGDS